MKKLLYSFAIVLLLASSVSLTSCTADELEPQTNVQADASSTDIVEPVPTPRNPK